MLGRYQWHQGCYPTFVCPGLACRSRPCLAPRSHYHAQLSHEDREAVQRKWSNDEIQARAGG